MNCSGFDCPAKHLTFAEAQACTFGHVAAYRQAWANVAIADLGKYGADLRGTIDDLRAKNSRAVAMLRSLEWADAGVRCWVCRGSARYIPAFGSLPEIKKGHKPGCTLAALLRELP